MVSVEELATRYLYLMKLNTSFAKKYFAITNSKPPKDLTTRLYMFANSTDTTKDEKFKLMSNMLGNDKRLDTLINDYIDKSSKKTPYHEKNRLTIEVERIKDDWRFRITGFKDPRTSIKFDLRNEAFERLANRYSIINGKKMSTRILIKFLLSLDTLMSSLYKNSSSYMHCAIPDKLYLYLKKMFKFNIELFASPLNARTERFCSANPEIDKYFGSIGKIDCKTLDIITENGERQSLPPASYECNPPYVLELCDYVAKAMISLCEKGDYLFVCCFPLWEKPLANFHKILDNSKFLMHKYILKPNEHIFKPGNNFLPNITQDNIVPTFGNTIYIIGSRKPIKNFDEEVIGATSLHL